MPLMWSLSRFPWISNFLPLLNAQWMWKTFLCMEVEGLMQVKKIHVSFSHSSQFLEIFVENSLP